MGWKSIETLDTPGVALVCLGFEDEHPLTAYRTSDGLWLCAYSGLNIGIPDYWWDFGDGEYMPPPAPPKGE